MQTRRQEILTILKQQGEATVDELARMLELTPVTVRHHLDILRADGLVEASAVRRRRGPGRPQYIYILTAEATDRFPKKYDDLVNELLDEMKTRLGQGVVKEILGSIANRRLEQAPSLDPGLPLEARLEILVVYLTEQGYIASWERKDNSWFVRISNCPYQNAATQHPELCFMDLFLLEQLSGTKVIRRQRITDGDYACTYQIVPAGNEQPR